MFHHNIRENIRKHSDNLRKKPLKIIQTAGTRWLTYGRASQRILDRLQEVARNCYSHMGQSIQE